MVTHFFGETKVVNYKLCNITSTWEAGTLVDFLWHYQNLKLFIIFITFSIIYYIFHIRENYLKNAAKAPL
jgi:hypothetical protein